MIALQRGTSFKGRSVQIMPTNWSRSPDIQEACVAFRRAGKHVCLALTGGGGKSCDVTTAGRNGKNDGGAVERSLNGNTGVDYLSKPSLAVVS